MKNLAWRVGEELQNIMKENANRKMRKNKEVKRKLKRKKLERELDEKERVKVRDGQIFREIQTSKPIIIF
jgi:hypothetical protein